MIKEKQPSTEAPKSNRYGVWPTTSRKTQAVVNTTPKREAVAMVLLPKATWYNQYQLIITVREDIV